MSSTILLTRPRIRPVGAPPPKSVSINQGDTYTLPYQGEVQLTTTVTGGDGSPLTWGSSNASAASVSPTGLVTWEGAGTAIITVQYEGIDDTIVITSAVPPATGDLVDFTSFYPTDADTAAKVAFVLGPQVVAGDGLVNGGSTTLARSPWPWLDRNALHKTAETYPTDPRTGYILATTIVTDPALIGNDADDVLTTNQYNGYAIFYDFQMVLWQNFYRTGDTFWRDKAIEHSNCWWTRRYQDGNADEDVVVPAPRSMMLGGIILTALYEDATLTGNAADGRSNRWDMLYRCTERQFQQWVWNRWNSHEGGDGIRDEGYATLFFAWVVHCLPDTYEATRGRTGSTRVSGLSDTYAVGDLISDGAARRTAGLANLVDVLGGQPGTLDGTPGFFGTRQDPDGALEYNIENSGPWEARSSQPWQLGILAEAWVSAHKMLTEEDPVGYATTIQDIEDGMLRIGKLMWATYLKSGTYNGDIQNSDTDWRFSPYFYPGLISPMNYRLTGTVDLAVDAVAGTTTLAGTGTLFQTEGLYEHFRLYFREQLGSMTVTSDGSVVGDGTYDFTTILPGTILCIQTTGGVGTNFMPAVVESVTDATHLKLIPEHRGTAQAGAASSITLASTASPSGNTYNDWYVTITGGTGAGQTKQITSYRSSRVATVDSAWTTPPDATSTYELFDSNIIGATNAHFGRAYALAGTFTRSGNTITGTGSALLSELQVGDKVMVIDDSGRTDTWNVNAVNSDTSCNVGNIQPADRGFTFTGTFRLARIAREGEARGYFRVQSDPVSETSLVLTPDYPGSDLTGRIVGLPAAGATSLSAIHNKRQQSWSLPNVFGWLYWLTGDSAWKDRGDEVMGAIWGYTEGLHADGERALWFYHTPQNNMRGKEFNENMRSSPRYLAYRLGGS